MAKKDKKEAGGTFEKIFADKRFCAVFSLFAAMVLWGIVVTLQPNTEWVISNVKVSWDYNTSAYSFRGLDIIDPPDMSVKLKVVGDGNVVSRLTASDFIVYPDYSGVTNAGTYSLRLEAKRSGVSFADSVNIIEVMPSDVVEVTFEQVSSKKFAVEVDLSELKTPDDYFPDAALPSPQEVTLRGPKSEIDRVAKVVAKPVLADQVYTNSILATAHLEYRDADGAVLEEGNITADAEQVEIGINIYKTKKVPVKIEYTGLPSNYDTAQLSTQLSVNEITIGGTPEQIDPVTEVTVGFIDMTKFEPGVPMTINVQLPEGLVNVDNVQTIVVNFNTQQFDSKTVNVEDIRVINVQTGVQVTVTTDVISDVKLVGEKNELEELSAANIVAQVDASSIEAKSGQVRVPVVIVIPGSTSVFATGSYTALCVGESAS